MNNQTDCAQFRNQYERGSASAHGDDCAACKQWRSEVDAVAYAASVLPQFDVPEQVTQNIMNAVEQAATRPLLGHYGLMLPLGIACAAMSVVLVPFDTIEGLGATAVAGGIMYLIQVFIKGDKVQETVAS